MQGPPSWHLQHPRPALLFQPLSPHSPTPINLQRSRPQPPKVPGTQDSPAQSGASACPSRGPHLSDGVSCLPRNPISAPRRLALPPSPHLTFIQAADSFHKQASTLPCPLLAWSLLAGVGVPGVASYLMTRPPAHHGSPPHRAQTPNPPLCTHCSPERGLGVLKRGIPSSN